MSEINGYMNDSLYRIVAVELVETKSYKPMVIRPYDVSVTNAEMGVIEDVVTDSINRGITDANVIATGIASRGTNILLPTATNIKKSFIANDWSTVRFAFKLLLEVKIPGTTSSMLNYVQGYSEYLDVTYKGTPDPEMAMYINSISVMRNTAGVLTTIGNYNTALDETGEIMKQIESERVRVTRPEDILTRVYATYDNSNDSDVTYVSNLGDTSSLQLVSNDIVNPVGHVASVVSSTVNNTKMLGNLSTANDIMNSTIGDLSVSNELGIDFIKILYKIYGEVTNMFLLKDLETIDPNMGPPTVILSNNTFNDYGFLPYEGSDTYDASIETRLSELVRVTVREVLNYSKLSSIGFVIENTNGTPNYRLDSVPTSIIPGLDLITHGEIFMETFIKRIWKTLSNNEQTLVRLKVYVLATDITIFISIDNKPEIPYVYPIFADSKMIPIQMDTYTQDTMAEGYKDIVDISREVTSNAMSKRSNSILDQYGYNF